MENDEPTHTDTADHPPTDPPADPPTNPPHEAHHELRTQVNELSEKVNELTGLVQLVLEKGEPDTTPVRRPWTHWGNK